MTQQVVRARCLLPDGDTFEDLCSFSWTWEATGSLTTIDHDDMTEALNAFFATPISGVALGARISGQVSRVANACSMSLTDITDHLDGHSIPSPFLIYPFTLAAADGAQPLPPQLTAVVGVRSEYATDPEHLGALRPRASDRGRMFIGPWGTNALASGVGGQLSEVWRAALHTAVQGLLQRHNDGDPNQFCGVVWSRKQAAVKQIAWSFVDEGWGTQRRREDTTLNRVHSWVPIGT